MSKTHHFVHVCLRVRSFEDSLRFYSQLGFELKGRLNFESATNFYLGLPGEEALLELTENVGREAPYDLGEGFSHIAVSVDDVVEILERLRSELGTEAASEPYRPGGREDLPLIAFVEDPDGYRVELIEGPFGLPQD